MHSGALRRAIGLTFLYIGVFVLLVFVQFSRGPGFSEAFGKLSIRATYAKADRGKGGGLPESVRLSYSGFTATISKSSPAAVLMGDGSRETLAVVALDKLQNGVRIRLDGGFELKAIVEPGAQERFVLSASGGGGAALPETVSSLSLGYRLGGRLRSAVGAGTVSFDSGGLPYSLHLSAATLDKDKGLLVLESRGGKLGGVAIERSAAPSTKPSPKPPAEQRISQAPKPAAIIKAEVDAWRDKVWNGLNVGRYDSEAIAWRDPDPMNSSSPVFTEEALCAYLAEALSRGSFPEALQRMRPAKERWADKLSYVSAPFMGGLVPRMQALEEADLVEVRRLGQLLQDRSPSIFEKEDLLHFLLDRAPYPIALDAFRFAAEIEPSKFTLRQAVGLLGCVVESRSYLRDEENPFAGSLGNVAETIAASIRKASEGFFLILEDEGSVDMRLSLLAGILLSEFGAAAGKDAYVGAGQSLIEGVLGLADAQGFVPSGAVLRSGALEKSGFLPPEAIYRVVADNPYYPREVSFYRDISPGVWAWTCAPSLSVDASGSRYVFTVAFPEGRSHYMAFYGIKSFVNIQLYDIDYSPDGQFEIYDASGFLYKKSGNALYLKMKHKKATETIKLFY
jgi:hypothetical protein